MYVIAVLGHLLPSVTYLRLRKNSGTHDACGVLSCTPHRGRLMYVSVSESSIIVFLRDMNSWKSPIACGISPLAYVWPEEDDDDDDDVSGCEGTVVFDAVTVVFAAVSFAAATLSLGV